MGAKVEIETMPGYLPTIPVDAPEELVEAAKLAAGDKYNVNVVDATSTPSGGSTDVGDVQHLQPVFTFNTGGAVGSGLHSVDFDVNDGLLVMEFVNDIYKFSGIKDVEVKSTPNGYHIVVPHGFDTRELMDKWKYCVTLKKDDLLFLDMMEKRRVR